MSCGDCTLCCTVMRVDLAPLESTPKPNMTACKHCVGRGCAIYDRRPNACRTFQCTWLASQDFDEGQRLPLAERPDRTGVVLGFDSNNRLIVNCETPEAWRADPAHKRLMWFFALGYSVTIVHGDERMSVLERDGSVTELEVIDSDPVTNERRYRRPKGLG